MNIQRKNNMNDLWIVTRVAMVCMMATLIIGTWYDGITYTKKVRHVPCSVAITDMAKQFNVTLLNECEVTD